MKRNDPYTRDDQTRFTMRINTELLEKIREDAEKNKRSDQTRFTMRINTELLEKIREDAEKNKRSTAKQIEYVLEQYILSRPDTLHHAHQYRTARKNKRGRGKK